MSLLIYRWIPQEEREKKHLHDLLDKQTENFSQSNIKFNNEIVERKLIEQDSSKNKINFEVKRGLVWSKNRPMKN